MRRNIVILSSILFGIAASGTEKDYFELRGGLENSRHIFEQEKQGRVVFLGGSITDMKGWKELISSDLQRRFPNTVFDFINAGIPSTGSTPAAFRLVRDVFKNGPVDLLFEEAAVNDSTNGRSDLEQIRGMEGIVRQARTLNPNIDIVLMHFVDPSKIADYRRGVTPKVIRNHERVAAHYGLPSINLALEVTDRIQRGEFTWENDFKDIHPSPFGHALYANTISRLFDAAWFNERVSAGHTSYKQPAKLDPFSYDAGKLLPPDAVETHVGFIVDPAWKNTVGGGTRKGFVDVPMLVGMNPGDSFRLSFQGSAIGVFVAAGPDAGMIEYRIDTGEWKTQDLFTRWSGSLHVPWLYMLSAELDPKISHSLEVKIASKKNAKSKGHACRIVNFAVNGQ